MKFESDLEENKWKTNNLTKFRNLKWDKFRFGNISDSTAPKNLLKQPIYLKVVPRMVNGKFTSPPAPDQPLTLQIKKRTFLGVIMEVWSSKKYKHFLFYIKTHTFTILPFKVNSQTGWMSRENNHYSTVEKFIKNKLGLICAKLRAVWLTR